MLFSIIVVLAIIGLAIYLTKKAYASDPATDTAPLPTIHDEIAKTIADLKTQDPVIIEAPFVPERASEVRSNKTTTAQHRTGNTQSRKRRTPKPKATESVNTQTPQRAKKKKDA